MKTYDLYIKSYTWFPDYEDSVEAESKDKAVLKFIEQMPEQMRAEGWGDKDIISNHIALQRDTPQ